MARFSDRTVVLVTGGNAGIGYEIVKRLALENPTTHHILMGTRDTSKGETAAASMGALLNVNPIQIDVTDDNSIEHCYKTIEQMFGKLDILIHNAGSAGRDLPKDTTLRAKYSHVYGLNAISPAILTEAMVPLLEKATLPKVIFITSSLGSISKQLAREKVLAVPFYDSSKSAMNMLCAWYSKKYPHWKVNACCPGLRATGLNGSELNEDTDPAKGATNAVRLAMEGPDGVTGTYSDTEGPIPW